MKTINIKKAIFELRYLYGELIEIIEEYTVFAGHIDSSQERLNHVYLKVCLKIENILGQIKNNNTDKPLILRLLNEYQRPLKNLQEYIASWSIDIKPKLLQYQSLIEESYISLGCQEYNLDRNLVKLYLEFNKVSIETRQWIERRGKKAPAVNATDRHNKTNKYNTLRLLANGAIEYVSPAGRKKVATFGHNNNDYTLLKHFIDNTNQSLNAKISESILVRSKLGSVNKSAGRRVTDTIKAIRKKLGKDVIVRGKDGYIMTCRVITSTS